MKERRSYTRAGEWLLTAALLTMLALAALVDLAFGHTAPSGWEYDRECCDTRDCAQVPDEAVREVAGGYQITLRAGQHPMGAGSWFIPHGDHRLRPSGDEHRHVCHMHGRLFCLYVRAGGV